MAEGEPNPIPEIFLGAFDTSVPPVFQYDPTDALRATPEEDFVDRAAHESPSGLLIPDRSPYTGETPQIPEYIKVVRFGRTEYSLSRHGRFAPPVTTIDTVEKLEELRSGIVDAATGKNTSARETAEVFFRVGANIPLRLPMNH